MIWVRGIKPISLHSAKKLLPKFRDGKSGLYKNLEPNPDPETSGGLGSLDSSAL